MKRVLFQGDSITDAGRSRENANLNGSGYSTLIAAKLGFEHPGVYEFINKGISGNRVTDLLARIKRDMINLEPDVMSILIGVNDVWHEIGRQNGVNTEMYEEVYNLLIAEVKRALPNIRILILEPFVLKGTATEENWEAFQTDVYAKAQAARRVAEHNHLEFIPLQVHFDHALKLAPADFWLMDGVHPTVAGHELIAREWLKVFGE